MRVNRTIDILRKLRINTNFNILKTEYHSLFESHLQYGHNYEAKKKWNNNIIPEASKSCPQEIIFKKRHGSISCVYKECNILKFLDTLNLTSLFLYQIQHNP